MRKKVCLCLIFIIFISNFMGCKSKEKNKENEVEYKNNYIETEISLPEDMKCIKNTAIAEDGTLRVACTNTDETSSGVWESSDDGGSWNKVLDFNGLLEIKDDGYEHFCIAMSSKKETGIFTYNNKTLKIIDSEGKEEEIAVQDDLVDDTGVEIRFLEDGNLFFKTFSAGYKVNRKNGDILGKVFGEAKAFDIVGDRIFAVVDNKLREFDAISMKEIEGKKFGKFDEEISKIDFICQRGLYFGTSSDELSAYCFLNSISYSNPGMVKYTKKGKTGLIDGLSTYFGDTGYLPSKIVIKNDKEIYVDFGGEEDKLVKYTYSTEEVKGDKTLTIYTLEDNDELKKMINAYQRKNPNIKLNYKVGIKEDSDITISDAIKKLNTEIEAGKGPDIILLDGLPIDSYISQKVLLDLSDIVEDINKNEGIFENIINGYSNDKKIYSIPTRFSMMVIEGDNKLVKNSVDFQSMIDNIRNISNKENLYNPVVFRKIADIFYNIYISDKLNKDDKLEKKYLEEYYDLLMEFRDMVEMDEDYNMNISKFDTTPVSFRDYEYDKATGAKYQFSIDYIVGISDYKGLLKNNDVEYSLINISGKNYYVPQFLLGINAKNKSIDEAKKFVKFALSKEVQLLEDGLSLNKEAIKEELDDYDKYQFSDEEKKEILSNINKLTNATNMDNELKTIILEEAEKMIKGHETKEKAVDNVMKKVSLYMEE